MAAVLDSVIVPRSSRLRTAPSVSSTASSISAQLSTRKVRTLPEFRGLRIQLHSQNRALALVSSRSARAVLRGGGIVCETKDTALQVPAVTEATWQSLVLDVDLPVLVEFWAPWCGPCRMIHPVIGELAKQYAGKLKCFKLNTDEGAAIATQYGIRSIPTVIIFKNGEKKDAIIGAVPKTTLTASIEKFL